MAGREGVAGPGARSDPAALAAAGPPEGAEPHRVLQVQPDACPEVVDAAFEVLREMVLRSDDVDAPRRLAELNAAHRALAGPSPRGPAAP